MSQFAAPDNLHIYPILIDKPNAKNQSVFPVHRWTENSKKLSFQAGGLLLTSPQSFLSHKTASYAGYAVMIYQKFFHSNIGSILGPLLFLVHINNLPNVIKNFQMTLYADDTVMYGFSKDLQHLVRKLNEDFLRVDHWLRENKLTLNLDKTKYMLISSNRTRYRSYS